MRKINTIIGAGLTLCIAPVFADSEPMDHSTMDHSQMDHSQMDHSKMSMGGSDASMAHMGHAGHSMAPAGIMKTHSHKKGGFMFSYGYMTMSMDGIKHGTDKVSVDDVFDAGYMMAPSEMSMEMHMLGAMYGMTDNLTLAVMTGYASKDMDMLKKMGMTMYSGESSGITDTEVSIVDNLGRYGVKNWVISYGVSFPTGSIDENGDNGNKLGYPMQLGSGTYDFVPSVTHQRRFADSWAYGVQGRATIRIGNNSEDYRLGNKYEASTWLTKDATQRVSISGILDFAYRDNISGADSDMNPMMSPSKDPESREATVISAGLAGRYNLGSGHNIMLRADFPIYEDLTGYQMMTDYKLVFNYKKMF